MTRRYALAAMFLVFAWLLSSGRSVEAQKMYKWTDKDGKVHFSNIAPPGEQPEEPSGVQGIEAQGSQPSAAPSERVSAPARAAQAAPASGESTGGGTVSGVSDEAFSSQASMTRTRLKRDLAQAKEEAREAGEKLEATNRERDAASKVGLEMLQKAYSPDQSGSAGEDELRKRKEKAEAKVADIRKQYETLREEAVKRNNGQQPGWWLPIE
jgi:hypothetical protein